MMKDESYIMYPVEFKEKLKDLSYINKKIDKVKAHV